MKNTPYNQFVDTFWKAAAANMKILNLKDQLMEQLASNSTGKVTISDFIEPDERERLEALDFLKQENPNFDEEYGHDSDGVIEAQAMISMIRHMFESVGSHPSIIVNSEAYHAACQVSDLLELLDEQMADD